MFTTTLSAITADDRRQLASMGVDSSRISEWKSGKRLPTRAQAAALAAVKHVNFDALERELVLLELERDAKKNSGFQRVLSSIKGSWQHT